MDDQTDREAGIFKDVLAGHSLLQHIDKPTHRSGHTLDLYITRSTKELPITTPVVGDLVVDHRHVESSFAFSKPIITEEKLSFRKIKDIDMVEFRRGVQQ